jgi:hypothetical protein
MSVQGISGVGMSGSYAAEDVRFLLSMIELDTTPLAERERLIASGEKHYSEMIGDEDRPSRTRMRLFRRCLESNGDRLAQDLIQLARLLAQSAERNELVIASIARAGTPIGVLLKRTLEEIEPHLDVYHYSISVIRDRGIDYVAMAEILNRHRPDAIRFVDGWTGKGTIAHEIHTSITSWAEAPKTLDTGLWVPLDVCGVSKVSSSIQDYLIPSTLLGGTISGLLSRSILRTSGKGNAPSLHQCVDLTNLRKYDLSRWFVGQMVERIRKILGDSSGFQGRTRDRVDGDLVRRHVDSMLERHSMTDRNKIKVGIGESIRVLLRRAPEAVYISEQASPFDAGIIRELASERGLDVSTETLPFAATAVIRE